MVTTKCKKTINKMEKADKKLFRNEMGKLKKELYSEVDKKIKKYIKRHNKT